MLENLTRQDPASQVLLFPLELELSPSEIHILKSLKETLCGMGFRFGTWEEDRLEVIAMPESLAGADASGIMDSLIAEWKMHEGSGHFSQADRIAKALCRTLSLTSGSLLEPESQQALVHDLFACKEPGLSPFNQKIHTTLSLEELEKRLR